MRRVSVAALVAGILLAAGPALADGGGGGGGSPNRDTATASCIQKGPDGLPVRKLSSEEVCPIYQFWREDCRRSGQQGLINGFTLEHCSLGALGIGRDDDILTGSIRPAGPAGR